MGFWYSQPVIEFIQERLIFNQPLPTGVYASKFVQKTVFLELLFDNFLSRSTPISRNNMRFIYLSQSILDFPINDCSKDNLESQSWG